MNHKKASILFLSILAAAGVSCSSNKQVIVYGQNAYMQWNAGETLEFQGPEPFTIQFQSGNSPCGSTIELSGGPGKPATCKITQSKAWNYTYTVISAGPVLATTTEVYMGHTGPCRTCTTNTLTETARPTVATPSTQVNLNCPSGSTIQVDPATAVQGATVQWAIASGPDTDFTITFDDPTACKFDPAYPTRCTAGAASSTPYKYTVKWPGCSDKPQGSTLTISAPPAK